MFFKLLYLFPDYKEGDWLLLDDGNGAYIKKWNRAEPQPTQAKINAVAPPQEAAARQIYLDKRIVWPVELVELLITKNIITPADVPAHARKP